MKIKELRKAIENAPARSAWDKGVKKYANDFCDNLEEYTAYKGTAPEVYAKTPEQRGELHTILLNGAESWGQFSWGGCSLIYNADIAERLCNPTELKRTKGGNRNPNGRERWLDVQARALYQAEHLLIKRILEVEN